MSTYYLLIVLNAFIINNPSIIMILQKYKIFNLVPTYLLIIILRYYLKRYEMLIDYIINY